MKKSHVVALVFALTTMVSGFVLPGCSSNETCTIQSRDSSSITLRCVDEDNTVRIDTLKGIYSDLYPKCQVNTAWPSCKEK